MLPLEEALQATDCRIVLCFSPSLVAHGNLRMGGTRPYRGDHQALIRFVSSRTRSGCFSARLWSSNGSLAKL